MVRRVRGRAPQRALTDAPVGPKRQAQTRGFGLIELMVAVAVLGLLASIAWPLYTQQVQQSQRRTAAQTLLQAQVFVEARRAQHHRWPSDTETDPASLPQALRQSPPQGRAAYRVDLLRPAGGLGYALIAQPLGGQTQDRCGALALTDAGQRLAGVDAQGVGGAADPTCWP